MQPFSIGELARMQRTLRRRYLARPSGQPIDVGFGVALRAGRFDAQRGLSACFFVRRKHRPAAAQARLPPRVSIGLRRRGRVQRIELATDVVEVGQIVATGWRFEAPHAGPAMAGAVVVWRQRSHPAAQQCCGILTVGHAFLGGRRPLVLFRGEPRGRDFNGRLYLKSRRPSAIDAALVRVHAEDLLANGLLDEQLLVGGVIDPQAVALPVVAPVSALAGGRVRPGRALGQRRPARLQVHAYFPSMTIPTLGRLHHVVAARSSGRRPFQPGTSGSLWEIQAQPAALQVAGVPEAFQYGFAQALQSGLAWARAALSDQKEFVAGSFKLVECI